MTGTQTLIARAALGTAGALASIILTRWQLLLELPSRTFDRCLVAALALSRIALFAILFGVLRLAPRGDIPGFYFPQAVEALRHHLPYRDFSSSYAPLHPYLDALFISLWRTPLAIILSSIFGELWLLPIWLRVARELFADKCVRIAALLYVASPISLQFVTVDGQDNVLIALILAASIWFALRSRVFLSGVLLGLSAATVKFLPLFYAPTFFAASPRRLRWATGATATLAVVYGGTLLLRLPILLPLTVEGAMRSAGNVPYLVESAIGTTIPARWSTMLLLFLLGAVVVAAASSMRRMATVDRMRVLTFSMAALTLILLLFSKKSWPPYLMLCLFPLCLLVAEESKRPRLSIAVFAFFSLIAVTEHSVWSSLLLEASSSRLHTALLAQNDIAELFFALHALLLAGYAWLLVRSLLALRTSVETFRVVGST